MSLCGLFFFITDSGITIHAHRKIEYLFVYQKLSYFSIFYCRSGANAVPFSRGNITFSILSQAPIARPGHNDFYNTPELYSFVKASSVRVSLKDHYYVSNPRHQYFGIYEFLVTGRSVLSFTPYSTERKYLPDII